MNSIISIVIIDTDMEKINFIKKALGGCNVICHLAALAGSVEAGLKAIRKHKPQIIFLDINMADDVGLSLLERLRKWDFEVVVVENSEFYKLINREKQMAGLIFRKIDISHFFNCFI